MDNTGNSQLLSTLKSQCDIYIILRKSQSYIDDLYTILKVKHNTKELSIYYTILLIHPNITVSYDIIYIYIFLFGGVLSSHPGT